MRNEREQCSLGEYLGRRLEQAGVRHYFTVPGDFNLVLLDQLLKNPRLQMIGCCNELNAGYAAEGYARSNGIGALVVTGPEGSLVGMFSERDVVRALATNGEATLQQKVSELMSTGVSTCSETTELNDLMTMMTDRRIRHVPVTEDGHLVGMISIGDVVKARLEELEHDKKDLLDYVSGR